MKLNRLVAPVVVVSLLLGSAASAEEVKPAAIDAFLAKSAPGAKKVKTFTGKLDAPEVSIFPIKKGHCYVVVLRLAEGTTMARKSAQMDWPDRDGQQQPVSFGPAIESATSAVFKPDCAKTDASVGVWPGMMGFDGIQPSGKGAYTFEVLERKAGAKEIAAETAADKKAHDDAIRERDASRAKTCGECAVPVSGRRVCLERRGVTMKDCGF